MWEIIINGIKIFLSVQYFITDITSKVAYLFNFTLTLLCMLCKTFVELCQILAPMFPSAKSQIPTPSSDTRLRVRSRGVTGPNFLKDKNCRMESAP